MALEGFFVDSLEYDIIKLLGTCLRGRQNYGALWNTGASPIRFSKTSRESFNSSIKLF